MRNAAAVMRCCDAGVTDSLTSLTLLALITSGLQLSWELLTVVSDRTDHVICSLEMRDSHFCARKISHILFYSWIFQYVEGFTWIGDDPVLRNFWPTKYFFMIWRLTMVKFRERPSLALLLHSGQRQLRANTAGRFSTPSSLLLHISCKYFVNMPSKHRQCQHGSKYFCGVIIIFPVCVKSVPGVSNDEHDYEGMTMITLT